MSDERSPSRPILVVDDEPNALQSLSIALEFLGHPNVVSCGSAMEAREVLRCTDVEAVLLDVVMPEVSGAEFLEEVVRKHPDVPVIMITAITDTDLVVDCMRRGASGYIAKPVDMDRFAVSIAHALESRTLRRQISVLRRNSLRRDLVPPDAFAEFLTRDPAAVSLLRYCEAVAQSAEPVLITGETGVGKELVARGVHAASGRTGAFVAVNVAGLDDHVFSDTLFGHRRGAFTGAERDRPGLVDKAAHGTLFLDEIGDLCEASQVKLLRLLQEREFLPLGSDAAKPSTARIVVATNADIQEAMDRGAFRQDLYFRLRTHTVRMPPLRERKCDLPILVEHFLNEAAEELGKTPPTYPKELLQLLSAYSFPGNVRELRGMVYDAVSAHASRTLSLRHFREAISRVGELRPSPTFSDSAGFFFEKADTLPTLREAASALVDEALRRAQGNQRVAANMLGITPSALNKRLKRGESDA